MFCLQWGPDTWTTGIVWNLELDATVTRWFQINLDLQTASQDFPLLSFLPRHPDMTYLSLLIIIIVCFSLFSGISRGPCNNWHYLGHVKHIDYDDDDDDDDEQNHIQKIAFGR